MKSIQLTEEQLEELNAKVSAYRHRESVLIYYKDLARERRELRGLKTNKITTSEMITVITHWVSNGRSNLKRSFQYVYDTADKLYKEVDWVSAILNSKAFGRELTTAFNSLDHEGVSILKNSKTFNISRFYNKESLSRRIRQLDIELKYEELLIEKENIIQKLESDLNKALELKTWEDQARFMLQKGYTQKEVADRLGKGIATIGRLVKKIKDEI